MTQINTDHSRFREWILNWLVNQLDVDKVSTSENLLVYGMDSVTAIMLVGDLEDQYQLRLPPTLVWDHPTVDSLVEFLASTVNKQEPTVASETGPTGNTSTESIGHKEAASLLANLDEMSNEEVAQLLSKLGES